MLKYCPLESLEMEGSRERELRAERSDSLSSFLCILHSSRPYTSVDTAHSEQDQRNISSQLYKAHQCQYNWGSDSNPPIWRKLLHFQQRLLYKCYGTAAFMFNNDSS